VLFNAEQRANFCRWLEFIANRANEGAQRIRLNAEKKVLQERIVSRKRFCNSDVRARDRWTPIDGYGFSLI
jgi:hypothetical protein